MVTTFYQTGPNGLFIFYQVFNLILQSAIFSLLDIFQNKFDKENNNFKEKYSKFKEDFPSHYFEDQHWLVKYELFYLYEHNKIIRKKIDYFYKLKQASEDKQYINYENFKKKTKSLKNSWKNNNINITKLINLFYIELLDHNVSFVNLKSAYDSKDI